MSQDNLTDKNKKENSQETFLERKVSSLPCKICGKLISKKNLKVHISSVHYGERPIKCTFPNCNKRFTYPCKLKTHILSHV